MLAGTCGAQSRMQAPAGATCRSTGEAIAVSKQSPDRDEKLRAKLKENLRRRKAQAKARATTSAPAKTESEGAEPAQPDDKG